MHFGRSWQGTNLEDNCPCAKAYCGLAISDSNNDCPEHGSQAGKTMRQVHDELNCPARKEVLVFRPNDLKIFNEELTIKILQNAFTGDIDSLSERISYAIDETIKNRIMKLDNPLNQNNAEGRK